MISILLIQKIAELFLMMFLGFAIVRAGVLRSGDSVVLSKICLYLIIPCVIIGAFQVDFEKEVQAGLLLAFGAALVFHVFLMILCRVLRETFRMTDVELGSVVYSNAGNLIIPIVTGVLGPEWVVYSSAFLVVQLVFIWTHGKLLFTGKEKIQACKDSSESEYDCCIYRFFSDVFRRAASGNPGQWGFVRRGYGGSGVHDDHRNAGGRDAVSQTVRP